VVGRDWAGRRQHEGGEQPAGSVHEAPRCV